jgi:hypothetical protein
LTSISSVAFTGSKIVGEEDEEVSSNLVSITFSDSPSSSSASLLLDLQILSHCRATEEQQHGIQTLFALPLPYFLEQQTE